MSITANLRFFLLFINPLDNKLSCVRYQQLMMFNIFNIRPIQMFSCHIQASWNSSQVGTKFDPQVAAVFFENLDEINVLIESLQEDENS